MAVKRLVLIRSQAVIEVLVDNRPRNRLCGPVELVVGHQDRQADMSWASFAGCSLKEESGAATRSALAVAPERLRASWNT